MDYLQPNETLNNQFPTGGCLLITIFLLAIISGCINDFCCNSNRFEIELTNKNQPVLIGPQHLEFNNFQPWSNTNDRSLPQMR